MLIRSSINILYCIILTTVSLTIFILFNIVAATAVNETSSQVIEPDAKAATAVNETSSQVIEPDKPAFSIEIKPKYEPIITGERQTITITVTNSLSKEGLSSILIWGNVTYGNKTLTLGKGFTNNKGIISYTFDILLDTKPTTATIFVNAFDDKYVNATQINKFKINSYDNLFDIDFKKLIIEGEIEDKNVIPIKLSVDSIKNPTAKQPIDIIKFSYQLFIDGQPYPKIYEDHQIINQTVNRQSLDLPTIELEKSKLDSYIYYTLDSNPYNVTSFSYKLKGDETVIYKNNNITLPYDDLAEYIEHQDYPNVGELSLDKDS
jgi:hypothetical protein